MKYLYLIILIIYFIKSLCSEIHLNINTSHRARTLKTWSFNMSHFTVAVITTPDGDVDSALAPFHEYECTGVKDEYVTSSSSLDYLQTRYEEANITLMKNTKVKLEADDEIYVFCDDPRFLRDPIDGEIEELNSPKGTLKPLGHSEREVVNIRNADGTYTNKIRDFGMFIQWKKCNMPCREVFDLKNFASWLWEVELPTVVTGEEPSPDWDTWLELDENGEVVDFFTSTNENAKWDWYVIGGRWANMLKTINGELVDSCELGQLDFDGETKRLQSKAHEIYDTFEEYLGELPKSWVSWKAVLADDSYKTIEERRDFYNNQIQVKSLKEKDKNHTFGYFGYDYDEFLVDRNTFVESKSSNPFGTYALLDATGGSDIGNWMGSDIGMFGTTLREEPNWEEVNQKMLRSFPKNYVITIVDCHI